MICRRIRSLLLATAISGAALQGQRQFPIQPTTISGNSVLEKSISGREEHLYRLPLATGQYARLRVEQRGIDLTIRVLDPAGEAVAEFDSDARPDGAESVEMVAPAGGAADWQLRIQPKYARAAPGDYEIRVQEIRNATAEDRSGFEAQLLTFRAAASIDAGDYDEAARLAARSVEEAEKAFGPDDARLCPFLDELGLIERRKGQYEQAEQTLQRLMAIAEKTAGRESQLAIRAMRGLSDLYVSTNNYAKAEPLIQEFLAAVEKVLGAHHPAMISALSSSAALHSRRQDMARSLTERERALAIADKTFDPGDYQVLASVGNLGDQYSLMGDFARAEPLLERTLTLAENRYGPDHPIVATALQNLGATARETGQYDRAAALLQRALSIREKTLGRSHPDTASLLINLGNVYHAKRDFPNALAMHLRALEILTAVAGPYHRLTLMALSNAGREYAAEGDRPRALEFQKRYADAVDKDVALHLSIGSEREKMLYVSSLSTFVDRLVSFHANASHEDASARDLAALVVLRHKGRVLDAVSGGMASLRGRLNSEDGALLDQLSKTNSQLATLALGGPRKMPLDEYRSRLAALEDSREKMESAISRRSAEFRALSQPVSLEAIRAAIPADAALVEFAAYRPYDPKAVANEGAFAKPRYIAYILRRDGDVRWADLGDRLAIDQAATAFRQSLRDPGRRDVKTLSRALDHKLLQPLRPLLGNAARLLISPDGSLNLIPFEALVDEQGRYLVQRVAVQYLTAGRDLLRLQVKRSNRTAPLVIADPLFGDPDASAPKLISQSRRRSVTAGRDLSTLYFAPLPGTAQEAEAIRNLFPDAVVLTGREATKAALRRVNAPSILHIATHGFFLDESPQATPANRPAGNGDGPEENPLLRSGLALAGANLKHGQGGDGVLTALEASTLDLWGTRIVTLSACETGLGEIKIGEGVYGLRRAFLLAGAETLVMSLWPVSDRFTRQIMIAYYAGLKKGLGRGDALRQAQMAVLRNPARAHPFYWAAFIQSGDWERLEP
jgi:CHAT domain-containing protein/Flp pilus assembly protein TadD